MNIALKKLLLIASIFAVSYAFGQSAGVLRGRVTDPTGAVIPGATVTATNSQGQQGKAVTDQQGAYEIKGLAPGNYTVTTSAKGFALSTEQDVAIAAGAAQQFNIALDIEVEKQKLEVRDESVGVSTDASDNASAIVIKGKDLDALPDDPDELEQDLQALAGPSAGPNGGQIYIDGFTGGQLPPKSSIREIRINQNPFSSEYDKLGYGRIEIFTKPGTDHYHGELFLDGNDSAFNSLNPFTGQVPGYNSELFHGSLGGPLTKKASFFFNAEARHINDSSVVDATVPLAADPAKTEQFVDAVPNPRTRINVGPRVDYQISKNNTLTIRYQFFHNSQNNEGIGQFSLPSQAYNSTEDEHTLQISDTQVLSTNIINETRFQFNRDNTSQFAQNPSPTIMVLGAFTGGGNQDGRLIDHENRYEFQNYTSVVHHTHLIKFGARLRGTTDSSSANSNFNGLFTFSSLAAYKNLLLSNDTCTALSPQPCGPTQFSLTKGEPMVNVGVVDAGLYAQDDWRVRPNFTLSYGLRFETQNQIHDHGDWAPRLSLAWGLGRKGNPTPKTVLRAGFGIFYDRFSYNLVEQAERLNGVTQQQFIVTNPTFFKTIPSTLVGGQISPTVYQVSPTLQAPRTIQSAVSIERQVTKSATVAVTYLNSNGQHQFFLRNANAPLPGTFTGPGTGVRPFGGTNNIYQYDSEGVFRQNQIIANVRINAGARLSLFGYYTLNYAKSDLGSGTSSGGEAGFFSGGSTVTPNFITNQYDPMADYGRSAFDVRHRAFLGGTISMPYAFRLNPFMIISSGMPYDITTGTDLNGDSIFNDRPVLLSAKSCAGKPVLVSQGVLCTPLGTFNTAPFAGQKTVPVNSVNGPTLFTLNLRLSKTFGFGRETKNANSSGGGPGFGGRRGAGGPGGGLGPGGLSGAGASGMRGLFGGGSSGRRYSLTFSVSARNVLNRVNLGTPVGELTSPFFAESNGLAGGTFSSQGAVRRIDLQVLFSF